MFLINATSQTSMIRCQDDLLPSIFMQFNPTTISPHFNSANKIRVFLLNVEFNNKNTDCSYRIKMW